jgi:hypothetical protein
VVSFAPLPDKVILIFINFIITKQNAEFKDKYLFFGKNILFSSPNIIRVIKSRRDEVTGGCSTYGG